MREKNQTGPTPGGVRQRLAQVLPLEAPFLVQIFPVYACNFRCGYCIYALEKVRHGYISDETFMDFTLYAKCIDDMAAFKTPLKMLRFAGIGEPLLHPQIARMVRYAKDAGIAESVDIVTNASMLRESLSEKLIAAGLSRLRISIEGLSDEEYWQNSSVRVDFQKIVAQIRYFYEHAGETKIYIKIIDYMVRDDARRQKFFELFSPICHDIKIEHLTPTIDDINYAQLANGMKTDKAQNGDCLLHSRICPQPFYMMQINPDGKVVPCCSMKYPLVLGDTKSQTVEQIWNGAAFDTFRLALLKGNQHAGKVCANCKLYLYDLYPEDVLDEQAELLAQKYIQRQTIR